MNNASPLKLGGRLAQCSFRFTNLTYDLQVSIIQFLPIIKAILLSRTSQYFKKICLSDHVWELFCSRHWIKKVKKYHLTSERKNQLNQLNISWKEIYENAEQDGQRQYFEDENELSSLVFDFRYRSSPKISRSLNFKFNLDTHKVSGHANHQITYEWGLREEGSSVKLGLFPPARVRRLKTWGWVLMNPNIICVSHDHDPDDVVSDLDLLEQHPELFRPEDVANGPTTVASVLLAELEGGEGGNDVSEPSIFYGVPTNPADMFSNMFGDGGEGGIGGSFVGGNGGVIPFMDPHDMQEVGVVDVISHDDTALSVGITPSPTAAMLNSVTNNSSTSTIFDQNNNSDTGGDGGA